MKRHRFLKTQISNIIEKKIKKKNNEKGKQNNITKYLNINNFPIVFYKY